MKNNFKFKKIHLLEVVLFAIFYLLIDNNNLQFASVTLITSSAIILYASYNNQFLSLISLFIFYCNYSIAVAYYIYPGVISPPNLGAITSDNLATGLIGLYLFNFVYRSIVLGYKLNKPKLTPSNFNQSYFIAIVTLIVYIIIFKFDRTPSSEYTVRITPIYEYSVILFAAAWFFSGSSILAKYVLLSLAIIYCLQDLSFGGRVSSVQLLVVLGFTIFREKFKRSRIYLVFALAIFLMLLAGMYRSSLSFDNVEVKYAIELLTGGLFTFETAVYGYYASLSHIDSLGIITPSERAKSFFAFIAYIPTSIQFFNESIFDISSFVNINYAQNYGGGVIFSHAFFWGGYPMIIAFAFLMAKTFVFLNNKANSNSLFYIMLVYYAAALPRWYLYTSLSLIRIELFLLFLFLIIYKIKWN